MSVVVFNFYSFKVSLKSECEEILDLLKKDFHYFLSDEYDIDLKIDAKVVSSIDRLIPDGLVSKKQNSRAITFECNNLRYNYFYGKAVSIVDYEKSYIEIYSIEKGYLHELIYLVILSRQTKCHDLNGLHKVHAFGIEKKSKKMIGMMDSKGGKTTLFSYFLDQEGVSIISDDTPMVSRSGEVKSFPIRIGYELNSYTKDRLHKYSTKAYDFNREEYGPKKLIDILEFKNKIFPNKIKSKNILFQGKRIYSDDEVHYQRISKLKMFNYLQKNMIVGVGLPMVLEYYLESSFIDKIKNIKILVSRTIAAINLLRKSECYEVYLSFDPQKNYEKLNELLELYTK